jgi:hypothetical protein
MTRILEVVGGTCRVIGDTIDCVAAGIGLAPALCACGGTDRLTAEFTASGDPPSLGDNHPAGPHHAVLRLAGTHVSSAGTASLPGGKGRVTVYGAPWPASSIVTRDYLYVPASALAPDPYAAADDCAAFGTGCSAEQLCDLWAVHCQGDAGLQPVVDGTADAQSPATQP